jgi:hypothetical protein
MEQQLMEKTHRILGQLTIYLSVVQHQRSIRRLRILPHRNATSFPDHRIFCILTHHPS